MGNSWTCGCMMEDDSKNGMKLIRRSSIAGDFSTGARHRDGIIQTVLDSNFDELVSNDDI